MKRLVAFTCFALAAAPAAARLPSTREVLSEDECEKLPRLFNMVQECVAAVRWARQPFLADGCQNMFFDVGANLGLHGRFLYEPEKFPEATKFASIFTSVFGADWADEDAKRTHCVVAFEPNPRHRPWLEKQAAAYQRAGWRYAVFFTAVGPARGSLAFYGNPGDQQDRGFAVFRNNARRSRIDVPVADLAKFVRHHLGPSRERRGGPRVVMKMDIEAMEFAVIPQLIALDVLKLIDYLSVEYHGGQCRHSGLDISTVDGGSVHLDDAACVRMEFEEFPAAAKAVGTTLKFVDDEAYDGLTPETMPALPSF